ncbi:hypothetical protein [Synechococcus sp. CBW1107]|uniref:hypothetical protein n=1 Tax=Synechococcus sp. CBW1107 TaxID=2789857 RepID=UPI002AD57264|nr:hypothetical protein [Synechococcus sp. CBW1107]CAK6695427.1 hypothetical protein ICNINCKA_01821 [Synechococcus sp. CBW1107]
MTLPHDHSGPKSFRYRFRAGKPIDPNEGLHPEMTDDNQPQTVAAGIPDSPQQLIAMQTKDQRPEKPERGQSAKVKEVLDLINKLETSAVEDQQIALELVRHLESFHDGIVEEMQDDEAAKHSQIVAWAIDADRLMRARVLLDSVDLD